MTTSTEPRINNTLDRPKVIKLNDEIRAAWPEIEKDGLTQGQTALLMTERCGFLVTQGNVRGAADGLGRAWPSRRLPPPAPAVETNRIADALERIAAALERLAVREPGLFKS